MTRVTLSVGAAAEPHSLVAGDRAMRFTVQAAPHHTSASGAWRTRRTGIAGDETGAGSRVVVTSRAILS
jgi:hypothetical protein